MFWKPRVLSRLLPDGEVSLWRPLGAIRDPALPKLDNLRRAQRAGLAVPEPTLWAIAEELEHQCEKAACRLDGQIGVPCIVRSVSPTEDTRESSNAGRFQSVVVRHPGALADALRRVANSLPAKNGRRLGAVAVQPLLEGSAAGVTFFDGFYFEETVMPGTNGAITAGHSRGRVSRGQIERSDRRSAWLLRLYAVLQRPLDAEWSEKPGGQRTLLQLRPALFPVRRSEVLSLANHAETLGDFPSPWITGVYSAVGHPVLELARQADPSLPDWNESYAAQLAGKIWINLSSLFRLMDRWGLPRSLVCRAIGGNATKTQDDRFLPVAFVRSLPSLIRMAVLCLASDLLAGREIRKLGAAIDTARDLSELWNVNVQMLRLSIRTNFALMSAATVAAGLRRSLRLPSRTQPVTHSMMDDYARLAAIPKLEDRLAGLKEWLARYGHRGPGETDPSRPRFVELEAMLRDDLAATHPQSSPDSLKPHHLHPGLFTRLLGRWEERREWFRDELMRYTLRLRMLILEAARNAASAGYLEHPEDVFFLVGSDLRANPCCWKLRVLASRSSWQRTRSLHLPPTAPRDLLEEVLKRSPPPSPIPGSDRFQGIGLGSGETTGEVVRAHTIDEVLCRTQWPESAILLVEALEPSWAVVYPRFRGVVSELGGELSHAAILLRESNIPSVINAPGVFTGLGDGDRVLLNSQRGEILRLANSRTIGQDSRPRTGDSASRTA